MIIQIKSTTPQTEGSVITCERGCVLSHSSDPYEFQRQLEKQLNEFGVFYGQVLDDANKFLCYDDITGAYVGNFSTDHDKMFIFLNKQHLDGFINHFQNDLPQNIEYGLATPFHKLSEVYEVQLTIV